MVKDCHSIPLDILDELSARFLIPLPQSEREDLVRVCFMVEQAHWFYMNHYSNMECGTMKELAAHLFHHVPYLRPHSHRVWDIVELWREYKLGVPTHGAVILNKRMDKVLLVQGFSTKASWGFPKGKINQEETPEDCAAREVMEEVGVNIRSKIDKDNYLEQVINNQTVRLYIVTGVEEYQKFRPNCQGEIKDIRWFPLEDLPTSLKDDKCKEIFGFGTQKMFLVIPFLRDLLNWVDNKKKRCQVNSQKMEKKLTLFQDGYVPEAWKNFKFDMEDILLSSMGLPKQFLGNLKIT